MARRVIRWTEQAATDLEDITAYIAQHSLEAAARVAVVHGSRDPDALWEREGRDLSD